jgi:dissimilatory sulfite reductase (desulfoviridin) alpha/beta subunit
MNALQIIEAVNSNGGRLWCENGRLRYNAPTHIIKPLLAEIKTRKVEIMGCLKLKLAASNDSAHLLPKRSTIYRITIDGKTMAAIDTTGSTFNQFVKRLNARFGPERVGKVENSFT